jgi:DNA (cytosine-5)-methyltransferase 1
VKYGSVCSGIEAATVAWHPLGWEAAWFSEIEPFPSAVLAHHYPEVPNFGDMTKIAQRIAVGEIAAPDVLVGGTPCQAFSVAGLRNGLSDPRGALTISYVELADAIDAIRHIHGLPPSIIVWENVPGVLSSKDNAFGCFLGALSGEGDELHPPGGKWKDAGCVFGPKRAIAWRILDAQYFGLAQRRRRVFVVASARDGFDPSAVLFEFDGVRRDSPPSRKTGEEVTHDVAPSLTRSGRGVERIGESRGQYPVVAVPLRGREGGAMAELGDDVGFTLRASGGGGDKPHVLCFGGNNTSGSIDVSPALNAHGGAGRMDFESECFAIQAGALRENPESGPDGMGVKADCAYTLEARAEVQAVCVTGNVTHALKAEGFDGSEDGTGRGQPIVAFSCKDYGNDAGEISPCLRSMNHSGSHQNGGGQVAIAWSEELTAHVDLGATLQRGGQGVRHDGVMTPNMQVRRLLPVECEKLQGFPPGYTDVPYRGKPAADGPRYKALGNSMAVPCMAWIGMRIDQAVNGNIRGILMNDKPTAHELDTQWLLDNGYAHDPDVFSCRVTRFVIDGFWEEEAARKHVVELLDQEAAEALGKV